MSLFHQRKLNLFRSPPDSRDFIITISRSPASSSSLSIIPSTSTTTTTTKAAAPPLPKVVDLSADCSVVKDQGDVGSCTSFATLAAFEYIEKKFNGTKAVLLSERFTYYVTRADVLKWDPNEDSGAYIREAVKSVVKYGSCLQNTFPYNGDYKTKPSPNMYNEAKKYQVASYAKFEEPSANNVSLNNLTIETLKISLNAKVPIIAGFVCFSNLFSGNSKTTGVIPLPNNQVIGAHAVKIIGFNDNTRQFKFKNSWGTDWGEKGYGYLPYEYYLTGNMFDMWSIYTVNDNLKSFGITITNPTTTKQVLYNEIRDILGTITENIEKATSKQEYAALFTVLQQKYRAKSKLVNLIVNMRSRFQQLAV